MISAPTEKERTVTGMAEKIEREAAIAALDEFRLNQTVSKYATVMQCRAARDAISRATKALESLPAADVITVVRCRECMHWKPTESKAGNSFSDMEYIGGCEFTNYCRRESDFCSYGERKDGDGNG